MRMGNLFCAQRGMKIAKGGRQSWDCLLFEINRVELSASEMELEPEPNQRHGLGPSPTAMSGGAELRDE